MRVDEARALADHLNAAADQAEAEGREELQASDLDMLRSDARESLDQLWAEIGRAEGRDELNRDDLDRFASADDEARAALLEAIERAGGE